MATIYRYKTLRKTVTRLRDDFKNDCNFISLYAHNGTGKTRLSMEFKDLEKKKRNGKADTLYFNAFTEDLFSWHNDFENDTERYLKINPDSNFLLGLKELSLEAKIEKYLERYTTFNFKIDYDNWTVRFEKNVKNPKYPKVPDEPELILQENIKISRGEENVFIWCLFLSICELAIDTVGDEETYSWVKYIYIDDPISSLDDNNAIGVASDLAKLLKPKKDEETERYVPIKQKVIISSHHSLFFNVICNELKNYKLNRYFYHQDKEDKYTLQKTDDTPFFHHVALLSELKTAVDSNNIRTYHFNALRSILEKTSSFLGYSDFGKCIYGLDDDVLFTRALNLLSHGAYSVYDPVEMNQDNKELFSRILNSFLDKHKFDLPNLI